MACKISVSRADIFIKLIIVLNQPTLHNWLQYKRFESIYIVNNHLKNINSLLSIVIPKIGQSPSDVVRYLGQSFFGQVSYFSEGDIVNAI